MNRYVAFLRGMNLGNRRIKNEELRAHFEAMGLGGGGDLPGQRQRDLRDAEARGGGEAGERGSKRSWTSGSATTCRSSCAATRRCAAIAAQKPFPAAKVKKSKGKLQVSLLKKKPSAAAKKKVLALAGDEDLLAIEGRELYWLPSGGLLESDLDLKAIEKLLGADTRRTMGTIEQIAAKYCA